MRDCKYNKYVRQVNQRCSHFPFFSSFFKKSALSHLKYQDGCSLLELLKPVEMSEDIYNQVRRRRRIGIAMMSGKELILAVYFS
jgi:hypothetical protein